MTQSSVYTDKSRREGVDETIGRYDGFFDQNSNADVNHRKAQYADVVNSYYDVVTDFYEYGWGESFHFAPRHRNETLKESLIRHEHYLAMRLKLQSNMNVLDVGCGVGGPMRTLARLSPCNITGITINAYQVERAQSHNRKNGLTGRCQVVQGDFMDMSFEDNSFDCAYAIESTCHAPDRRGVFDEIFRVLKPGGYLASYEWCMTDAWDPKNATHNDIKHGIEAGDGLPDLVHTSEVEQAFTHSGFEILDNLDAAKTSHADTPWYQPLDGRLSLKGFRHTHVGRWVTHGGIRLLEAVKIAPKGSANVSTMLMGGAQALVAAGKLGIFTPMQFYLTRKPL